MLWSRQRARGADRGARLGVDNRLPRETQFRFHGRAEQYLLCKFLKLYRHR